ncbi:hypothetical protein HPB48_014842 [Haemaphysalis longicornis]|uniref:carbonic anhydrase n=1 Tax=Haemaphysalis longicornis TaxID=44386 RepID=A0A9J6GFI9_HAELO|nr:hypothetical protein HPB48_014842 [Haemaphysalis longicornis]
MDPLKPVAVKSVSIQDLLPDTDSYMTYEGSSTTPGCEETVTWILMNRPLYMTRQQLFATRKLMQGDAFHPKAPLGNNFRPTQPLHGRVVRTNIDIRSDLRPSKRRKKLKTLAAARASPVLCERRDGAR